ncbi:MAG: DUF2793 domain-containing protein [Planctomycetes bacterium]|nr:DUF2793 domain-containing protein [Planctomycetota bacterium]
MADPVLGLAELLEGDALGYLRQNDRNLIVARLAIDCRIASNNLTAPPSAARGNAYILGGAGTGLWSGKAAGTIALALSDNPTSASGWYFYTPQQGHRAWLMAGTAPTGHIVFDGTNWVAV